MAMRTSLTVSGWAWISVGAATCVALSALSQRPNFFSAAVYVARSNACTMALWNAGVFATFLFGRLLQAVFFGPLRTLEVEVCMLFVVTLAWTCLNGIGLFQRLHERAWFAVTETLLALTIFRDEFDTSFVVLFVSLLFIKVFHWLAADRVEMVSSPFCFRDGPGLTGRVARRWSNLRISHGLSMSE
jgi:hypothetical protein